MNRCISLERAGTEEKFEFGKDGSPEGLECCAFRQGQREKEIAQ